VTRTFVDAGNFSVRLTVTDNDNATDTMSTIIEVRPTIQVSRYSMTPIPSLKWPEDGWVNVTAINNKGQVTGQSYTADGNDHVFIYTDGSSVDLDTLGSNDSVGWDVNESGEVSCTFATVDGGLEACHYAGGVVTRLGTLGYPDSGSYSVNDAGRVVGVAGEVGVSESYYASWGNPKAFLYSDGVMRELGTLGGAVSAAWAINNNDQIVGVAATANGTVHAFLHENNEMRDLGTLGGDNSTAIDVNDRGQVIGLSEIKYETGYVELVCFIYSDGVMKEIESPKGGYLSPAAINSLGQVVGLEFDDELDSFPFIWDEVNGVRYLNEMADLPPDCHRVHDPADINDLGQILVHAECGYDWDEGFGFVLTPVR
jgi:probable HAF family extracellular repeat protein